MKSMRGARFLALAVALVAAEPAGLPAVEAEPKASLPALADRAMGDLLEHWWNGTSEEGHISPTHGGYVVKDRGAFWERAMLVQALDGAADLAGPDRRRVVERMRAEWRHDLALYRPDELERCGPGTISPWSDDAGWALLYYMAIYRRCDEPEALAHAKGLCRQMVARWHDAGAGGLWYNDDRRVKSLYAVAYVLGALEVFAATGETEFRDQALAVYDWLEKHLLRPDHLYWCEESVGPPADPAHPAGPVGSNRPDAIHPAGSVVYLGGNMGMSVCQARLFELTQEARFRDAALATTTALCRHLVNGEGCFINDRDAFNNGAFASLWARHVLRLPGVAPEAGEILKRTARQIASRRTDENYAPGKGPVGPGFYPADWDGGTAWKLQGSWANMLHVSASSVGIIVGAALADR